MAFVYILYSQSIDSFYIGSCLDLDIRIKQHLNNTFNGFTSRSDDWQIFFTIENLAFEQARKIEKHIKKMKSKNLLKIWFCILNYLINSNKSKSVRVHSDSYRNPPRVHKTLLIY